MKFLLFQLSLFILMNSSIQQGPVNHSSSIGSNGQKIECPVNKHTDNIIPIIYGKPARETMEKAEKGLIYLGGCVVSGNDPRYYCTTHQKKF